LNWIEELTMKLKLVFACTMASGAMMLAQPPDFGGGGFGPGGFGGPGRGGRGPMNETRKLLSQFDKDGDGILNAAERKAARDARYLARKKRAGS